ncbi:MAG: hypothetical protein L6366_03780, partial [Candidatus Omnitrophica bacterium]|nr:hypothetical protein [Candidatus Omnitrophota bacterium]
FGLFSELDSLLERIKNGLYTTYTQKMLDHNLKVIRLARNLYSTKLLNRDLTQVKKYEGDFKAQKFRTYVEREAKRLKLELPLPRQEDMEAMEKTLPDLENFYYYASQRDNILAVNTLNGMAQEKESVGVLVTGGFHTDGIAQYLKEKRVSYVVICPVIDKLEDDDERYINALKGKKTPFEEMLEKEGAAVPGADDVSEEPKEE